MSTTPAEQDQRHDQRATTTRNIRPRRLIRGIGRTHYHVCGHLDRHGAGAAVYIADGQRTRPTS